MAHTNCVTNGAFDLGIIMWEVSDYLFGDEKPAIPHASKIKGFYDRLQKWAEDLPSCIDQKTNATPAVMDL